MERLKQVNGTVRGYMRISTTKVDQKFDRQEAQLEDHADVFYADRVSGSKRSRPELDRLLDDLEEGDVVLILSIDRLSRSTKDLLDIVDKIRERGASLLSLQDSWLDTTSENPMSDFLLTVMGALAEMERKQTVARVNEGLAVAKKKGKVFGRPKANQSKVNLALDLYDEGKHTVKEISEITDLSRKTIYNKLNERKDAHNAKQLQGEI